MRIFICRSGFIQFPEFLILFICCCSCFYFCSSTDIITVSHPLTDPENITSSNNDFQLGFFSPVDTTNRYVGIWYSDMIAERSVLWVANRGKPLADSSGTLAISKDGNLVILNGKKDIIWSSNVSTSLANSSAQLLDSGNLVLLDKATGRTVWESFQHPTDSIVQGMRLSSNRKKQEGIVLNSWKSSSDPNIGSFYTGVSVGTVVEVFVWNGSLPYWRSGPWNNQKFIGIENMASKYSHRFTVEDNKEEGRVSVLFNYTSNTIISYLFLDPQGTIWQKYWDRTKPESVFNWSSIGSPCDVYGKCGAFGSCNPKDSPICSCLRGFEPRDVEEWKSGIFTGGCVRRTPLQCGTNDSSIKGKTRDGFLKLTTMKVPDFINLTPNLDDECERKCYNDCWCTAYVETVGIGCMLWNGSLIDLQKFSSNGVDLYVRLADSELGFTGNKRNLKVLISATVIAGLIAVAILIYIVRLLIVKQRDSSKNLSHEEKTRRSRLEELPLFTFKKLTMATDNFNEIHKLGQGGFGKVYRGNLSDGQEIAVKRLSASSGQGMEEFMNEVVVISKVQHRNLVRLLGCCIEGEEKILVYEYMPNKSLDSILFDPLKKQFLDWSKRLSIIDGICRGLLYLHRDSRLKIIHRDLKASNILLDTELNPKISDFGMARIIDFSVAQANTKRVVGTYGYMAPEYAMQGKFSEKSDVFSFGVLILEIISGHRNTSFDADEDSSSLLAYAWKLWNEDNIEALIDQSTSYREFEEEILKFIHVGLLCVQEFAADRPTTLSVLSMLRSETMHFAKPKQPAFTQTRVSIEAADQNMCSINGLTVTVAEGR